MSRPALDVLILPTGDRVPLVGELPRWWALVHRLSLSRASAYWDSTLRWDFERRDRLLLAAERGFMVMAGLRRGGGCRMTRPALVVVDGILAGLLVSALIVFVILA